MTLLAVLIVGGIVLFVLGGIFAVVKWLLWFGGCLVIIAVLGWIGRAMTRRGTKSSGGPHSQP